MLGSDLTPAAPTWISDFVKRAADAGEDIPTALDLTREFGARLALPGGGQTLERWSALARVAEVNLTVARVFEAHTDALAILAEAGIAAEPDATWGVYAAEAPKSVVRAEQRGRATTLTGVKPWCSLGDAVDRALVTAHVGDDRGLYQVDLTHPQVHVHPPERWVARGLRTVVSVPIEFDHAPASPVGEPGWYLRRSGFAWGGIGVAACWFGATAGLGAAVVRSAAGRSGELAALHAGIVDVALHAARATLCDAARAIDSGTVEDPELLALRVRTVVAEAAERVLHQAGRALGPAPLGFDADHAARVADLTIYIRQHHGERDLAAIGERITRP